MSSLPHLADSGQDLPLDALRKHAARRTEEDIDSIYEWAVELNCDVFSKLSAEVFREVLCRNIRIRSLTANQVTTRPVSAARCELPCRCFSGPERKVTRSTWWCRAESASYHRLKTWTVASGLHHGSSDRPILSSTRAIYWSPCTATTRSESMRCSTTATRAAQRQQYGP